jgi:hypothetical protein
MAHLRQPLSHFRTEDGPIPNQSADDDHPTSGSAVIRLGENPSSLSGTPPA